jgi:hypothetical protein
VLCRRASASAATDSKAFGDVQVDLYAVGAWETPRQLDHFHLVRVG